MSSPAMQPTRPAARRLPSHIHLMSVHVRKDGAGYDYDEDLYAHKGSRVKRIVRFVAIDGNKPTLIRQTYDVLCEEELAALCSRCL